MFEQLKSVWQDWKGGGKHADIPGSRVSIYSGYNLDDLDCKPI